MPANYEEKLSSELYLKERVKLLECLNCGSEKRLIPQEFETSHRTKGIGMPVRTDTITTIFNYAPFCDKCHAELSKKTLFPIKFARIEANGDSIVKPQGLDDWYLYPDWIESVLQKSKFKQYLHEGLVQKTLGNHQEAQKLIDRALELNPESELSLYFKAEISIALGNYEEGIKYYEEAIKLEPDFEDAVKKKTLYSKQFKKGAQAPEAAIEVTGEVPFKPPKLKYKESFNELYSVVRMNPILKKLIIHLQSSQKLHFFDIETSSIIQSIGIGKETPFKIHPNGEHIFIYNPGSNELQVKDISTFEIKQSLIVKKGGSIHITSDGRLLVCGSTVYNLSDYSLVGNFKGVKKFNALAPDDKTLLNMLISKKKVELWDIQSRSKLRALREKNDGRIMSPLMKFTPDGKYIMIIIQNQTIEIWDISSGSLVTSITEDKLEEETVTGSPDFGLFSGRHPCLQISPNGKYFLTNSMYHNLLYEYELPSGSLIRSIPYPSDMENMFTWDTITITPNGKYIYLKEKSSLCILDYQTGQILHKFDTGSPLIGLDFTQDNKYLITKHPNTEIMTWEL